MPLRAFGDLYPENPWDSQGIVSWEQKAETDSLTDEKEGWLPLEEGGLLGSCCSQRLQGKLHMGHIITELFYNKQLKS